MSEFELIEIPFNPDDFESTLEDEFLTAKIVQELEAEKRPDALRDGAIKLLKVAMQRQAMIRGLCKRLAALESNVIRRKYSE